MFRLGALAAAACIVGGCAQIRPEAAGFAAVPAPVIIDRYGITRTLTAQSAKACLTHEPTAERSSGQHLPSGCANNHNASQIAEPHHEMVR